jgi:hypothetical protein
MEMAIQQPLTNSEKTQYTNEWCRSIGIKSKDLGCGIARTNDGKIKDNQSAHGQIDDVILLIAIREEFWPYMDKAGQGFWARIWDLVYHHEKQFKKNWYNKFNVIIASAQFTQAKQKQRREKIQALRANAKEENEEVNMKVNPSSGSESLVAIG